MKNSKEGKETTDSPCSHVVHAMSEHQRKGSELFVPRRYDRLTTESMTVCILIREPGFGEIVECCEELGKKRALTPLTEHM